MKNPSSKYKASCNKPKKKKNNSKQSAYIISSILSLRKRKKMSKKKLLYPIVSTKHKENNKNQITIKSSSPLFLKIKDKRFDHQINLQILLDQI
jgi:hypothetical protein